MEFRQTSREVFYTFSFQVYFGLIGFLISIILTRAFSYEEFGQYSIVMKYIMIMHTLGLLGLDIAGINYMSNNKIPGATLARHILPLSFISGIFLFVVAWLIFPLIYHFSPKINLFFYAAIPLNLLNCVTCALLLGSNHIFSYNLVNNARDTLYIVLITACVIGFSGGLPGAAIAYLASTAFTFAFALITLRRFGLLNWKNINLQGSVFAELLSFGKYTYLSDMLWFLVLRLDVLMVGGYLGLKAAGIYSVASQLADLMRYLPRAISLVIMPKIPGFSPDETKRIIVLLAKSMFIVLIFMMISVYYFGETILQITFPKYISSYSSLLLLCPGTLFLGVSQILSGYYTAKGFVGIYIPIAASALVLDVALVILFVPQYGLPAAAVASSISYFVSFLVALGYFYKKEKLRIGDLTITTADFRDVRKIYRIFIGK